MAIGAESSALMTPTMLAVRARDVGAGDDGRDPRQGARGYGVDTEHLRMAVRRAQNGGVQRSRPHAEIVDVAAAPGEQRAVLDPFDRLPDPGGTLHPQADVSSPALLMQRRTGAIIGPRARRRDTRRSLGLPKSLENIGSYR